LIFSGASAAVVSFVPFVILLCYHVADFPVVNTVCDFFGLDPELAVQSP
jgi:hypothetical protein